MFLSRMHVAPRLVVTVSAALLAALLFVQPAAAQSRRGVPPFRLPPDAKGFQIAVAMQQYHQQRSAAAAGPSRSRPAAVTARSGPPRTVSVRGPDGRVRIFEVDPGVVIRRSTSR